MVMEVQPNPQSVGREFVRQYYTLLNQAPDHLHRFYNHNSLFVHGGMESVKCDMDPVVGQKQIHQRILQLNFRDCHAKISQVDSQTTLGNGVVVQVSGELSNGGQPMRRFTQTFVLAAQSPKKYYVHNDIFRYQDMFTDEDIENESGCPDDEQQVDVERNESGDMSPQQNQNIQGGYYRGVGVGTSVAVNGGTHHDEVPVAPSAPQAPQGIPQMIQPPLYQTTIDFHHLPPPQQQQQPQQQTAPPQQLQTTVAPPPQLQQQQLQQQQPQQPQPPQQPVASVVSIDQTPQVNQGQGTIPGTGQDIYQHADQEEEEEEEEEPEETAIAPEDLHHEDEEDSNSKQNLDDNYPSLDNEDSLHENVPAANEPPTYATRLKSGTGATTGTTTNLNISPQAPAKSPSSPPPRLDSRNDISLGSGRGQTAAGRGSSRGGPTIRGMSRGNDRPSGQPRPAPSDDGNSFGENDKRRSGGGPQQYPDNQQLFLGNLPLSATENDLRELFGKFGSIVDLRIMNKPNMKGQTGNKLPNYGFIVFEDVNTVQTVLSKKPFYFPPTGENAVKLNVEEKKTRARGSTDGRINSGGDVRPRMGPGGGASLRGGNRGFLQGRGIFPHGRGGTPMRPGAGFNNQRSSIPR